MQRQNSFCISIRSASATSLDTLIALASFTSDGRFYNLDLVISVDHTQIYTCLNLVYSFANNKYCCWYYFWNIWNLKSGVLPQYSIACALHLTAMCPPDPRNTVRELFEAEGLGLTNFMTIPWHFLAKQSHQFHLFSSLMDISFCWLQWLPLRENSGTKECELSCRYTAGETSHFSLYPADRWSSLKGPTQRPIQCK